MNEDYTVPTNCKKRSVIVTLILFKTCKIIWWYTMDTLPLGHSRESPHN